MHRVNDQVFLDALSLPCDARISLVEKLLKSLNLPTEVEVDRLWAEEAEKRVGQINRGVGPGYLSGSLLRLGRGDQLR